MKVVSKKKKSWSVKGEGLDLIGGPPLEFFLLEKKTEMGSSWSTHSTRGRVLCSALARFHLTVLSDVATSVAVGSCRVDIGGSIARECRHGWYYGGVWLHTGFRKEFRKVEF